MTENEALLGLNAVPGLGSVRIRRLVEKFGSAQAVWKQRSAETLCRTEGFGRDLADHVLNFDMRMFLENESALIEKFRISIVTLFDDFYPPFLKEISCPPMVLYVMGRKEFLPEPGIAIVGSRRASYYGISVARMLAGDLARAGVTVISGMARGVDTAAHAASLEAGGKTIAVLGSGLACLYPKENEKLARMISGNGCVISEFPMSAGPSARHFPRRNRVISGLSRGVVVVEAASRSGALITAECALEQGREVYAVPGKVGHPQAFGVNALIQQGAKLVMSAHDIFEDLQMTGAAVDDGVECKDDWLSGLSRGERDVLALLSDEPLHIDEVIEKTSLNQQGVLSMLSQWECLGRVKRLPGQYFVKLK
ncbi:MAG: DNA-processing protein DprA [Candidatus Omnitrophota bacterium]